ncbi:uncharacterized protein LDX57_006855 [Aspergillus melleus]|uniref:uncharacterized protein n=1 Tax=Aspergillus melleus TaxID=138277 RepID=UPI001E8EA4F0|nr:uncharacterized protein LDX57_006855 [Aspergillus melleus]KAH8429186.1 hypothetical protein LDX57_006855 [Aspergillus melleus]
MKLQTPVQGRAHSLLGQMTARKAQTMGLGLMDFAGQGATKYVGQQKSTNEGDASFINLRQRPNKDDWPHLVIEAGLPQSLPRLQSAARWWLEHSGGKVDLVVLLSIKPTEKEVTISKWVPGPVSTARYS